MRTPKRTRGQAEAIGAVMFFVISLILMSFLYEVSQSQYAVIQYDTERVNEKLEITNTIFGGAKSNYPKSTTPSGSGAITNLNASDQQYVTFDGASGYLKQYPVSNMNFTYNRNGWLFQATEGASGVSASFVSDDGNPSPGSGPGSIYSSLSGKDLGPFWLNWTFFFTYSSGQPLSANFSWARKVANWTQMDIAEVYVVLNGPSPGLPLIVRSTTINSSSPDQGAWFYEEQLPISASAFAVSGNYNLTLALLAKTKPGVKGHIWLFFDDVGIILYVKPGWSINWYSNFKLDEIPSDITKLTLQYTGHYCGETLSNISSPSSGTLLGSTATVLGSSTSLTSKDSNFWQMRSYGTATATDPRNPTGYNLLGSTTYQSGSTSDLTSDDAAYMAFRSYPSITSSSFNPSSYNLLGSTTLVSGSVSDLTSNDNTYMTFRSYPITTATAYNPSGYSLLGSTSLVSGSVSDLTSDNGAYMTLRSYSVNTTTPFNPTGYELLGGTSLVSGSVSDLATHNDANMILRTYPTAFSTTSQTRATIIYRSNTGTSITYPKARTWDGTTWSSESELPNSGNTVYRTRLAYCTNSTRYYEKIAVTVSSDGYIDAYVWTGSSWSVTNNIGFVGTTAAAYRPFDIAYEETTGRAILVYGISSTDTTRDLAYRIWDGNSWSSDAYIDDDGHTTDIQIRWVTLESKPTSGSNEIGLIYIDGTNSDADAFIWDGNAWGNRHELTGTVSSITMEAIDIAYEQTSGNLMIVAGESGNIRWNRWTGSWGTSATFDINTAASTTMRWLTLKADPTSNRMMLASVDSGSDLCTADWSGSTWTVHTRHDATVDTNARRCADIAWEPSGSKVLLVWGTTSGSVSYKTWTSAGGWTSESTVSNAGTHPWIQLRRNPRDVAGDTKILGATLNSNYDIFSFTWDGTTLAFLPNEITASTTVVTYECFEIDFQRFGDPSEYTSEVEFTGTSNIENWNKLVWTAGSSWTAASVSTTIQVYNYNSAQYPTSGDGYLSYTSSATPSTYEEKTQTITSNPAYFRDGSGNWKIKIKGVKVTDTQFDFKADWIEHKPSWTTAYQSEAEFTGTGDTDPWTQLQWSVDSAWTTGGVSTTIQVYNYNSGGYPSSGDGYLAYTSSSTPNTDETKTQTITSDSQYFRDGSGNWKIKVTGYKAGLTQFDSKIDLVEYKPTRIQAYQSEVEFTGTSNTETWTQLQWTIDSAWTQGSVSVTAQVYNYNLGDYSSSGDGYLAYTSSSTPNIDETKTQTITTNPQYFRDSSGNWKIKITGYKAGGIQFDSKIDWTEHKPSWVAEYISEVEFTGTTNMYDWTQLQWSVDSAWTLGSVSVTIQVYDYNLGGYPSSGDGYSSYTSSASPDTDETRIQTITSNPEYFRDGSGNWKIKITGRKSGATSFDFKADWVEHKDTYHSQFTSDWYGQFVITEPRADVTKLNISYWGYYSINTVSQTMYIFNFSSSSWLQLGSASTYTTASVGQFHNQTTTLGLTSLIDANGTVRVRIQGVKNTVVRFDVYADYLGLAVYTWCTSIATSVSQKLYIWDYDTNGWSKLSTVSVKGSDLTQGPFEITESVERYISPLGDVKVRIQGEADSLVKCYANQLQLVDYYKDRTKLSIDVKNTGPSTVNIVAIWINNSTLHERINLSQVITLVPGATYTYTNSTLGRYFSTSTYEVKVVTQRGNIESYTVPYTD